MGGTGNWGWVSARAVTGGTGVNGLNDRKVEGVKRINEHIDLVKPKSRAREPGCSKPD